MQCRRALLSTFEDDEDPDTLELLPDEDDLDTESWQNLFMLFESRFLADTDYQLASYLDAPADQFEGLKPALGIERDYFVSIAPDPTEKQMHKVAQKLAKLLDLPCPDDEGRFPAIYDRYSGLSIGPCTAPQIDTWSQNPWMKIISLEYPSWDCEYDVWRFNFMKAMLAADPLEANESPDLIVQREHRRQAALDSIGKWPDS